MTQNRKISKRGLLTKKPFYRPLPDSSGNGLGTTTHIWEQSIWDTSIDYEIVRQSDFIRELDTNSHAINDPNVYKTYRQNGEDGLYYEEEFPRYAFPFQQEILDDRLARLTGNDIQFELAEKDETDESWNAYNDFKGGWAEKGMERAWYQLAKSVLSTGDGAFVGIMSSGKFKWRVLSFADGDMLYPHYDRKTGEMSVFARGFSDFDDDGNITRYVEAWDEKYYYRFCEGSSSDDWQNGEFEINGFFLSGFSLEEQTPHGFDEIPVAYKRDNKGACWSQVQETIEHYEAAFSRLAQNNHDFGLPIMYLKGQGRNIHEIATSDMSYASKIFIIPSDGDAGFLQRQDASSAYKTELDELRKKIYEGSMVVKAPELKSGDTPAAAIKLLYSDSYNKALLETQEYDDVISKMIHIFKWGYGIESKKRLSFINTNISAYAMPYIPINDNEATTILATAVQNGFCSRQTASEKFYFSTPREWERIKQEKHDEKATELLVEEQRLDIQSDNQIETQEALSDIQTEAQINVIKAQDGTDDSKEDDDDEQQTISHRKGNVRTGRGRGRPNRSGKAYDENRNWAGRDNWTKWNATH